MRALVLVGTGSGPQLVCAQCSETSAVTGKRETPSSALLLCGWGGTPASPVKSHQLSPQEESLAC